MYRVKDIVRERYDVVHKYAVMANRFRRFAVENPFIQGLTEMLKR